MRAPELAGPEWDEIALGGPRGRIFVDPDRGREVAADVVHAVTRRGDDDAVAVDGGELAEVGAEGAHLRFAAVDGHVASSGVEDAEGRRAESRSDGIAGEAHRRAHREVELDETVVEAHRPELAAPALEANHRGALTEPFP